MTAEMLPEMPPEMPPEMLQSGETRADTAVSAVTLLVMAKSPVAGQVKTRLCPPLLPDQAAAVATAALLDTMDVVSAFDAAFQAGGCPTVIQPALALAGQLTAAPGGPAIAALLAGPVTIGHRWWRIPQRGNDFTARLVNAHAAARRLTTAGAVLQIGMDTPQLTVELLAGSVELLGRPGMDAVLGLTSDGGWWALGLREPRSARLLHQVRMSTAATGIETLRVLRSAGLRVGLLPTLTDVDTIRDAEEVAVLIPDSRFATVLRAIGHLTTVAGERI